MFPRPGRLASAKAHKDRWIVSCFVRHSKFKIGRLKTPLLFAVSGYGVEQDFSPASQPIETLASAAEVLSAKIQHHEELIWLVFAFRPSARQTSVRARLERSGRSELASDGLRSRAVKHPKEIFSLRRRPARSCSQQARVWLAGTKGSGARALTS